MECLSPELINIVNFIIDLSSKGKNKYVEQIIHLLESITNNYNFCSSFHHQNIP